MNRRTSLLIACLLLPSVLGLHTARAEYTSHPGTWDNCVIYLPSFSLYPEAFKQTAGGAAAGIGDPVGEVDSGVGAWKWDSPATATDRRPILAADGGLQFGTIASNARFLRLTGSEAHTKTLHANGEMYFMLRWKPDAGFGSGSRVLFSSNDISSTVAGVYALQNGANTLTMRMNNGTATPAIQILTTDAVPDDNTMHVLKGRVSDGTSDSDIQVDHGTKIFGTRTATLSSSDAGVMYVGNRASATTPLPGRIYELWIGTAPPTAAQEAEWDANNAAGSITGRAVLETPTFRCELEPLYGQSAMQHRWNRNLVIAVGGSEGSVYRLANNDTFGSVHATDVGGTPEVLSGTEVWVDGVSQGSLVAGGQYKGESSVKFRRQVSESGPSYMLDSTVTSQGNKFTEDVTITRRNDGESVILSYPIRVGKGLGFEVYRFLDAEGEITGSGTLTSNGLNDAVSDPGCPAVAQWDSARGIMSLSVLTRGTEYGPSFPTCELFGSATGNRPYWRSIAVANATAGQVFRFRVETRYYTTTSEAWEALAQSEVVRILRQGSGKQRIGLGIGIGLGSVERKNPAQKLTAAFNHEFGLAP